MRSARVAFVVAGAAATIFGIVLVLATQRFDQLLSLAVWLAGAIILHDGVFAPATTLTSRGVGRAGGRLPQRSLTVIRMAWGIGVCLTLLAVPLIVSKSLGARNPTVLAGDYGRDLMLMWIAVAAITLLAAGVGIWRSRRTSARAATTPR